MYNVIHCALHTLYTIHANQKICKMEYILNKTCVVLQGTFTTSAIVSAGMIFENIIPLSVKSIRIVTGLTIMAEGLSLIANGINSYLYRSASKTLRGWGHHFHRYSPYVIENTDH